ncbi:MAG: serine hydroxymethyltransferase [Candidatus Aenigmatarchaeota archaeon]
MSKIKYIIKKEVKRQKETINLIPSENFVSKDVLYALGSPLTNKYSEGYPSKRYYPGNIYYDELERYVQSLALKAFRLNPKKWAVNVQPYSGSPANLAVYLALMNPGEKLIGFSLTSGGHLTHGHSASYSGKLFNVMQYSVDPNTGKINYENLEKLAVKFKPKIIVSGITSYPRKLNFKKFYKISKRVNAFHVADIAHIAGLVLAKLHPSPFPYADVVTMTTHKTLRGPRGALIFMRKELEEKINKSVFPGLQGGPHNNVIAAIGIMFEEALRKNFINYQRQIVKNAKKLAHELIKKGFKLYTNGTDNHLMVIDLKNIGIDGKTAEKILESANIIANRNSLPGDTSPFNPSGLRLGTPAITTRKMREKDMPKIADFIYRLLIKKENPIKVKKEVLKFIKKFPLNY